VYNIEDRAKAKLTAESGLRFAMLRLTLYQEAYNYLQNNESAKDIVKQKTLDTIWNFPFAYPIPKLPTMNLIQKDSIDDFHEETLLDGNLLLSINNISNKINLNMLRISLILDADKDENEEEATEEELTFSPEVQLIKVINNAIEKESERDEAFGAEYYGLETDLLVNELKYFLSDPDSLENTGGGDENFISEEISPKKGPLVSFSELYTLPSWPDSITNLIKSEFTVHGAIMIDLNKITDALLKLLVPDMTEDDIADFFKYRNNDNDPRNFNSLEDFQNYIVNIGNVMTEEDFTKRFENFLKQGLQFGPTPTLFKITSTASVGRSTYNLVVFVTLPAQPKPRPPAYPDESEDEKEERLVKEKAAYEKLTDEEKKKKEEEDKKTLLLKPRIVEVIIG